MYSKFIPDINQSLKKTRKAIVGLGCSYMEGQGAFEEELEEKYGTIFQKWGVPLDMKIPESDWEYLFKKYPSLEPSHIPGKIKLSYMENSLSFLNQLCKIFFEDQYTSINLGQRGKGNRSAVKELYFYPMINWNDIDEMIILYCPSSQERFDFVNDTWMDHGHWHTIWPHPRKELGINECNLWDSYSKIIYSEKNAIIEQIAIVNELLSYSKVKNAKLIIIPAFSREYTRDYFTEKLGLNYSRNPNRTLKEITPKNIKDELLYLVDLWPWSNTILIDNEYTNLVDYVLYKEFGSYKDKNIINLGGTKTTYFSKCGHFSKKGNNLVASKLYEILK